jgi:hypothetical protein
MMNKYIVVIESTKPPQLFLGDSLAGGKVVELKAEELPHRVTAAWLAQRFNLSRKTIIEKVGLLNKGDQNKHLYDPKEVMPLLENLNVTAAKRGARRKN